MRHRDCPGCRCDDGEPDTAGKRLRTAADTYRLTVGWMLGCTATSVIVTILTVRPFAVCG